MSSLLFESYSLLKVRLNLILPILASETKQKLKPESICGVYYSYARDNFVVECFVIVYQHSSRHHPPQKFNSFHLHLGALDRVVVTQT